jgi:hypothetical protein
MVPWTTVPFLSSIVTVSLLSFICERRVSGCLSVERRAVSSQAYKESVDQKQETDQQSASALLYTLLLSFPRKLLHFSDTSTLVIQQPFPPRVSFPPAINLTSLHRLDLPLSSVPRLAREGRRGLVTGCRREERRTNLTSFMLTKRRAEWEEGARRWERRGSGSEAEAGCCCLCG